MTLSCPHEPPYYVVCGATAALGATPLDAAVVCAEPDPRSPEWLRSVYTRLLVASGAPVAVGDATTAKWRARFEAARWLIVREDADLNAAQHASWPALPTLRRLNVGLGSLAPALVVVGERASKGGLPFYSRAGVWLWRALRTLGHDELAVYVTNSRTLSGKRMPGLAALRKAFAPYDPTWVALGHTASVDLADLDVVHVPVRHSAYYRRWRYDEGPEGYAAHMRERGVPLGPWREGGPTGSPTTRFPSNMPGRLGELPPSVAYVRVGSDAKRDHVKRSTVLEARRLWVAREAGTFKEIGERLGLKKATVDRLRRIARDEDWDGEREKAAAESLERAKEAAAKAEAKAAANSRKLAWAASERALAVVLRRISDGSMIPSPHDAARLAELAITFVKENLAEVDDDRVLELKSMSLQDLAVETLKTMRSQWGEANE